MLDVLIENVLPKLAKKRDTNTNVGRSIRRVHEQGCMSVCSLVIMSGCSTDLSLPGFCRRLLALPLAALEMTEMQQREVCHVSLERVA